MSVTIRRLTTVTPAEIDGLAAVLMACVSAGASVSFMNPLTLDTARNFWQRVADDAAAGKRALLVAEIDGRIVGTVQLVFDLPENQPHRADLAKMLVEPPTRRHGIGARLLAEAEQVARTAGRWLFVLDTASADAERLYERMGWIAVGVVPDYALLPDGGFCDTRFYHRRLDRSG